ncbi:tetraspanin-36-like [Glandiceps talaboti]
MSSEGCSRTAKCVMIVLGILFWVAAAGLVFVSVRIFQTYHDYRDITETPYTLIPAAVVLGAALFMFITGLIGCCGACKEHKCLLATFFTLILLILLLQITAAILGFVYRDEIKDGIETGLENAVQNYTDDVYQDTVDKIQKEFKCCGAHNYTDWKDIKWGANSTNKVPMSCCKKDTYSNCTGSVLTEQDLELINQKGCLDAVEDMFRGNLKYIAIGGAVLAVIMLIGMIFACVLICTRKDVPYINLDNGYRV